MSLVLTHDYSEVKLSRGSFVLKSRRDAWHENVQPSPFTAELVKSSVYRKCLLWEYLKPF